MLRGVVSGTAKGLYLECVLSCSDNHCSGSNVKVELERKQLIRMVTKRIGGKQPFDRALN